MNQMNQTTCSVCNQSFSSDRDLQEHQRAEHSSQTEKQPATERSYGNEDQRREKIA
jgi:hypothetical protein